MNPKQYDGMTMAINQDPSRFNRFNYKGANYQVLEASTAQDIENLINGSEQEGFVLKDFAVNVHEGIATYTAVMVSKVIARGDF